MLSQITRRQLVSSVRTFSTARVALSEGAINQANDAFSDKEKAQENLYIKKHEQEQLKALREKLQQQKEAIDQLETEIEKMKN